MCKFCQTGAHRMFIELANSDGRIAVVECRVRIKWRVHNPDDLWVDENGTLHEEYWTFGNHRLSWDPAKTEA